MNSFCFFIVVIHDFDRDSQVLAHPDFSCIRKRGHISADSGLRDWPEGFALLLQLRG
jgi:predicted alpha/beta hydrolase family esterase